MRTLQLHRTHRGGPPTAPGFTNKQVCDLAEGNALEWWEAALDRVSAWCCCALCSANPIVSWKFYCWLCSSSTLIPCTKIFENVMSVGQQTQSLVSEAGPAYTSVWQEVCLKHTSRPWTRSPHTKETQRHPQVTTTAFFWRRSQANPTTLALLLSLHRGHPASACFLSSYILSRPSSLPASPHRLTVLGPSKGELFLLPALLGWGRELNRGTDKQLECSVTAKGQDEVRYDRDTL